MHTHFSLSTLFFTHSYRPSFSFIQDACADRFAVFQGLRIGGVALHSNNLRSGNLKPN